MIIKGLEASLEYPTIAFTVLAVPRILTCDKNPTLKSLLMPW